MFREQNRFSAMDNRFRWRWSEGHPSRRQHADKVSPAFSQPHTRTVRCATEVA
jgi:hypothetical protein